MDGCVLAKFSPNHATTNQDFWLSLKIKLMIKDHSYERARGHKNQIE